MWVLLLREGRLFLQYWTLPARSLYRIEDEDFGSKGPKTLSRKLILGVLSELMLIESVRLR